MRHVILSCAVMFWAGGACAFDSVETLGEALFHDVDLSANRTQSCASCHVPELGFVDPRGAVSPGDDGVSMGVRNAPTLTYAALTPAFHWDDKRAWIGGQFPDGRAATLEDQAGGPPLNPIEMGMADKAAVVARLREKPGYVAGFGALFGEGVLEDPEAGFDAMTAAIAAFERTDVFAQFDSKYDRFLRGEATLSAEEDLGRRLFFSERDTNCSLCHQLRPQGAGDEVFSNFEFHNIGVPANPALTHLDGPDLGLAANPVVDEPIWEGMFRVPTLRNVAVTGPYMHNGVFADLRTTVAFYAKYTDPARSTNPETGAPWGDAEVVETIAWPMLEQGRALSDTEIDAITAFLSTLTDARYEGLLD